MFKSLRYNQTLRLFFDFYIINELWFRTIGQKQFGYAETKILPYNKEKKIDEVFHLKVSEMKSRIIHCLEKSIRGEIKHFENCGPYRHTYTKYRIFIKKYGNDKKKWPLEIVYAGFNLKGWDSAFGGKKWAKATEALIQLKESKSVKDDIYLIDKIFDLAHNNGFILNKTYFKYLEWYFSYNLKRKYKIKCVTPLNYRFRASPEAMMNFASFKVKKVYIANKNYLNVAY